MGPAPRSAIERERVADAIEVLGGSRLVVCVDRRAQGVEARKMFAGRQGSLRRQRHRRVEGEVQRNRGAGRQRRRQRRAFTADCGGRRNRRGEAPGVVRRHRPGDADLLAVVHGLRESHARRPALEPGRAERLHEGMREVRVDGHTGHQRAAETVLARDPIVVNLVLGACRRVPSLDVILGQTLRAVRMSLLGREPVAASI